MYYQLPWRGLRPAGYCTKWLCCVTNVDQIQTGFLIFILPEHGHVHNIWTASLAVILSGPIGALLCAVLSMPGPV